MLLSYGRGGRSGPRGQATLIWNELSPVVARDIGTEFERRSSLHGLVCPAIKGYPRVSPQYASFCLHLELVDNCWLTVVPTLKQPWRSAKRYTWRLLEMAGRLSLHPSWESCPGALEPLSTFHSVNSLTFLSLWRRFFGALRSNHYDLGSPFIVAGMIMWQKHSQWCLSYFSYFCTCVCVYVHTRLCTCRFMGMCVYAQYKGSLEHTSGVIT